MYRSPIQPTVFPWPASLLGVFTINLRPASIPQHAQQSVFPPCEHNTIKDQLNFINKTSATRDNNVQIMPRSRSLQSTSIGIFVHDANHYEADYTRKNWWSPKSDVSCRGYGRQQAPSRSETNTVIDVVVPCMRNHGLVLRKRGKWSRSSPSSVYMRSRRQENGKQIIPPNNDCSVCSRVVSEQRELMWE